MGGILDTCCTTLGFLPRLFGAAGFPPPLPIAPGTTPLPIGWKGGLFFGAAALVKFGMYELSREEVTSKVGSCFFMQRSRGKATFCSSSPAGSHLASVLAGMRGEEWAGLGTGFKLWLRAPLEGSEGFELLGPAFLTYKGKYRVIK